MPRDRPEAPRAKPAAVIVINALHSGGAEKTCIELARYMQVDYDLEVVGLILGGPAEEELRSLGVKVTVPAGSGMWQKLTACWHLASLLRQRKPEVVITFLYLADLVGGCLARVMAPRASVFWNIRNNVLARNQVGAVSHVLARVNAYLSRIVPSAIVYCSQVARTQHESIGFRGKRSSVVENSPGSVPFTFSAEKRDALRRGAWNGDFVFLFVGRFDRVKRVDVYIEACIRLYRRIGGKLRFLVAGRAMDAENPSLRAALESSGIGERFLLLGHVSDQQEIYSAADCLIVTSESEGSPNAVYEAMATRLQTIIFATVGTEAIDDPRVRRLEIRDMEKLVEVMAETVARGIPPVSVRQSGPDKPAGIPEHPLVTFYKSELRCT